MRKLFVGARRCMGFFLGRVSIPEDDHHQPSIRPPEITTAVAALEPLVEMIMPVRLLDPIGLFQFPRDAVAFGVDIRPDVVSDLTGGIAETNASVESCRAKPEGPIILGFLRTPEPDMMSLPRAVSDRLLEGEILLAAEKKQTAHGSPVIRPAENRIHHNTDAAAQCNRVGRIPSGGGHGLDQLLFGANESDIDGITGVAVGRARETIDGCQRWMVPKIDLPDRSGQSGRPRSPRQPMPRE